MTIKKKLGRPVTAKTARVRSSVKSAIKRYARKDDGSFATLSTNDIAKLAKQKKERTIFALRFFETNGMIVCVGRSEPNGRGQPPKLWKATPAIFE